VRIIAGKETKAKLKALGKSFVDCWNEVNKLRLEQYRKHELVDFAKTEKIVYEKHKAVLHGANVQQVTRKNASAWKSFFELSKKKKEGELPKWIKPKPPHKKKDNLFLLIRNDRYKIKGNERNTNFWSYSSIIKRIKEVAQEYGIKVKLVDEENTSKTCSLCGKFTKTEGLKEACSSVLTQGR